MTGTVHSLSTARPDPPLEAQIAARLEALEAEADWIEGEIRRLTDLLDGPDAG